MVDHRTDRYQSRGYLDADRWLLEHSGIFSEAFYRKRARISAAVPPAEHYLTEGWRRGLEPGPGFDGRFLYPYFRAAGMDGPPAMTYIRLRASGAAVYANRLEVGHIAKVIRNSGQFDAAFYAAQSEAPADLDRVLHYVVVGDQLGLCPSEKFSPPYYRERHPELVAAPSNTLFHFIKTGTVTAFGEIPLEWTVTIDLSKMDGQKKNVLIVSHQATRTGAPILAYNVAKRLAAKYNVIVLLLHGGELADDFKKVCACVIGPLSPEMNAQIELDHLVTRILRLCPIAYAIGNTVESRFVFKSLSLAKVPVIALVHEFATHFPFKGGMGLALQWATTTIYSAGIVAKAAFDDSPYLQNQLTRILPQGPSELPPRAISSGANAKQPGLKALMRPPEMANPFVVLGCGTVCFRKGVDVFVSTAMAAKKMKSRRPLHFFWIGRPTTDPGDVQYANSVREQIARSGLADFVHIHDEVANLDPAYEAADLYFLSSRFDPLPNVTIDSALRGIPVVCFDQSSGLAEILSRDPVAQTSIVPYLDVPSAAQKIVQLADDSAEFQRLSSATKKLAKATFDMDGYVNALDQVGREATAVMTKRAADVETVSNNRLFDPVMYLGPHLLAKDRTEAIRMFVAQSAHYGAVAGSITNFTSRRPCAGFHPHIYAYEKPNGYDRQRDNPLAHFIRNGQPAGPWLHEVIEAHREKPGAAVGGLRVAVHAHFFYPELINEFLFKLGNNEAACDLVLTTNEDVKALALRTATEAYHRGKVSVRVVPNRGRDIGPLLTLLGDEMLGYDIIGHLHGKRSLHAPQYGEPWREFLWQNLLGGAAPMMDIILTRFADDESLGLVFPNDPHLSDWDADRDLALDLAGRMGLSQELPPFFEFPIGTMFWARPKALKPLFDLKLDWVDYPEEPVPIDGTILHAIERLIPFTARSAGYRFVTTNIPGITW